MNTFHWIISTTAFSYLLQYTLVVQEASYLVITIMRCDQLCDSFMPVSCRKFITIKMIDNEAYKKDVIFTIELGEPKLVKNAAGMAW